MIGIRELRADLAAAVRRAGAGHRQVVTIGGRAVAQLGPIEADGGMVSMGDLIATGAVVAPRRPQPMRPIEPVQIWSGVRLDRALKDLRG